MKVLIVGLGQQGEKYINYFLKNNYDIFGVCKTQLTKDKISLKYGIDVFLDGDLIDYDSFDLIIISLPPEIQGKVSLDILQNGYKNKLIIEIPVTWNEEELEKLKKFDNVIFFLEEYYTLLSKFIRKIDFKSILNIEIKIKTNKADYDNLLARKVTFIHINNNFLGLENSNVKYDFSFHESENIFYEVIFYYNGIRIHYVFDIEKYLFVGDRKYIDEYNFDFVLKNIINEKNNFNKFYNLTNV